jgi:hypothetical protein
MDLWSVAGRQFPKPLPISPFPHNHLVMSAKRLLLPQASKAGGGGNVPCECSEHASAYNEWVSPGTAAAVNHGYQTIGNGSFVATKTINLTAQCCVLAVGEILTDYPVTDWELEQPAGTIVVDQEDSIFNNSAVYLNHYASWEVLPAGSYTYRLYNRSGATRDFYASQLKVIASDCLGVGCTCQHHAHGYYEFAGANSRSITIRYSSINNNNTIRSVVITTTSPCCINCVGTIYGRSTYDVTDFELEQPLGSIVVDQEDETPSNSASIFHYASWRVLAAGTYTYYLINRAGASRELFGAQLKAVAFTCG